MLNLAAFTLLCAALVWAPLPLGSNRPWAWALLALWVWLGVVLAASHHALHWQRTDRWAPGPRRAAVPLTLLAALVLWVALPLWAGGGVQTLDAFATRQYLLKTLAYAGAALLVALSVDTAGRARALLGALLAAGLLQSMLAIGLHSTGQSYNYLFEDFDQGSRAMGTFVNPDNLAGFMEICLAAGIGLMLALMEGDGRRRLWREQLAALAAFVMSPKMLLRLGLVALVIALVLTRSRMGNGAFFISMLLVGALVAARSVRLRRPALWLVASMVVVDLVVVGQWVGLDVVVKRLQGTAEASSDAVATFGLSGDIPPPREQSLMGRLEVPIASLPLIAQRPVAGWGGGAYAQAFAPIKPHTIYAGFWDHAHNDYVQVAVETGLVGLALWLALGVGALLRSWPLLPDKHPRLNRGIGVANLMALCSLGLHTVVDFNLQIPATALALTVLTTLAWLAPHLSTDVTKTGAPRRRSRESHTTP